MGDDPTGLFGALNSCGSFTKVRVDIAPGTASCQILTGGTPWTCAPSGTYAVATGAAINTADLLLTASGAVKCDRKATIALYRPNGEVAEIYGADRQLQDRRDAPSPRARTARTTTATA